MTNDDLRDRVAIVTGASSGIGRATAELLAARGSLVAVFARSGDRLRELAARHGERMLAVEGDIADPDAVKRLFAQTEARFGDCDLLVNNAGMIDPAPLHETSVERWRQMFAVTVDGTFFATRRALPAMLAKRAGAIVNVASISGVVGPEKFPNWVSYCAAKGALISMTEALAVEIRDKGVRVNCVSPGSVDTQMWSEASGGAPASMTAEEVARTIVFLLSEESRPMNGQNLHVYSA
jgi:NAD(P)-dependent dehydrogenase (short-subunit alcohol dehydrogenase family)